jgi:predicted secreted Zn-dependent protease
MTTATVRAGILLTAAALLAPFPAMAVDYAGPRIDPVEVAGDVKQVVQQMRAGGPDGFFAYTHSWIDYHFTTLPGPSGCTVQTATVKLTVSIRLPHLQAEASTAEVVQHWKTFAPALRLHEDGHAAIALATAREIEAALWHTPAQTTCPATIRLAKAAADTVLADLSRRNASYDAQTGHGRTQGAVFP